MLVFLIILICILFYDIKVCRQGEFFNDYSAKKQTSTINGIFTILIFLSHSSQYLHLSGALDKPYLSFRNYLGQLVVVSFLFFSGFGIMESISKKGVDYVKSIPKNRLFKTWFHFAIAIVLFLIADLCIGKFYSIQRIMLSLIGLSSVGNSSWYMFVTFMMYIIIYGAFMLSRKNKYIGVAVTFAFTLLFAYIEYRCGLANRFFNTVFCFPAGMLFSLLKPKLDKWVMKNDITWALTFAAVFSVYYYFSKTRHYNVLNHNLFSILAVLLIMMITMKVKVGNTILDFFGEHIFSIFILQRIPMIVLKQLGFTHYKYTFIVLSFIFTICLALVFDNLVPKLDKKIFTKKKKAD